MANKTTAKYPTGKLKVKGFQFVKKPLMIYEEDGKKYPIKSIDFSETTAWSNFADAEFYNKSGKFTINVNKIKSLIKKEKRL